MIYLITAQIIVSILLVICIALQQKGAALGSAFGGGGESYSTKRGFEKKLFYATVVLTVLFIGLGIANLLF
ncbi:preprotein translocase subunit SecG [Patescibacteria group bacterium]|nr:preprotein translocase subunit SecG [Patescibacteria group bacterium]